MQATAGKKKSVKLYCPSCVGIVANVKLALRVEKQK